MNCAVRCLLDPIAFQNPPVYGTVLGNYTHKHTRIERPTWTNADPPAPPSCEQIARAVNDSWGNFVQANLATLATCPTPTAVKASAVHEVHNLRGSPSLVGWHLELSRNRQHRRLCTQLCCTTRIRSAAWQWNSHSRWGPTHSNPAPSQGSIAAHLAQCQCNAALTQDQCAINL